jgi:hypothetical protein
MAKFMCPLFSLMKDVDIFVRFLRLVKVHFEDRHEIDFYAEKT